MVSAGKLFHILTITYLLNCSDLLLAEMWKTNFTVVPHEKAGILQLFIASLSGLVIYTVIIQQLYTRL